MTDIHLEKHFEDDIVKHLTSQGWVQGTMEGYEVSTGLITGDAVAWIRKAHPEAWKKLEDQHGSRAQEIFLSRLVAELTAQGTLKVLRHGFKIAGAGSTHFTMAQFKPKSGRNPEALELYGQNTLRVVRQVYYSQNNKNSIDLVLFLNGLPIATLELKTESTQSIHKAITQYRKDRLPKDPVTNKTEPLLQFKSRCVVHFAVSTEEVHMTTELKGDGTYFLPFNLGDQGGKGNPVNPSGPRTAYLWETILQKDNWLAILGDFVHLERKEKTLPDGRKTLSETMIFPRYHQWDAVSKLVQASKVEGPGKRYLIQHSAGSGKSNSIAWLAHHLSGLHNDKDQTVFDAVIVITDRTVLDKQLQDNIYQFQKTAGVVEGITNDTGAKSNQLRDALLGGKRIIVVTIQSFLPLLEKIGADKDLSQRSFAVIADEAHTSQSGGASSALKRILSQEGCEEDDITVEDLIQADLDSRNQPSNVSFYAFTATPKAKTIELFGRSDADGVKHPFHSYTMRQAIEEGFILDVLQNYISYQVAYKLAHQGKDFDKDEVDKSKGLKALNRWVRLHPTNISQKVALIVEHFKEHVVWRLNGQAKAMVVTGSRDEVVSYKIAIDKYIKDNKYRLGTLIAFSSEIIKGAQEIRSLSKNYELKDDKPVSFTERNMNPGLRGQDIREAFDTSEYHLLLVANKYQTGFDQPKLVAMYLDKKLGGVSTVQTLSRLNRTYPGKDWTVVVDFINDPDQILVDFQQYYKTASLPKSTDPNLIYALQNKLDAGGIYLDAEVEEFSQFYWQPKKGQTHFQLQQHLQPPAQRFKEKYQRALREENKTDKEAVELFVKDLASFLRLFEFLAQIVDYGDDLELEKRYGFFKELLPILTRVLQEGRTDEGGIDLSGVKLTHHAIRNKGQIQLELSPDVVAELPPAYGELGSGEAWEPERVKLLELIEKLNSLFEGELSDSDLVNYAYGVRDKLMENETLKHQALNNRKDQFEASDDLHDAIITAVEEQNEINSDLASQVMRDEKVREGFLRLIRSMAYEEFNRRFGTFQHHRAMP